MALKENYKEIREKAIAWLKTQAKDFMEGLSILQESGYKPTVATNIAKWGKDSKHAKDKLIHVMYSLVGAWADPGSSRHDDENPTDGTEDLNHEPELLEDETVTKLCDEQGYPDILRRVLHEFYALMKERTTHKTEADKIKGDDEESNEQRKTAYEKIEAISERMDILWATYEKYKTDGSVPDESLFLPADNGKAVQNTGQGNEVDLTGMELDALKKLKKNEGIKLTKAKNMLEYQAEKRLPEVNPMPEGPKRAKYEKKVADLTVFIEKIDYAIVEKS